MVADGASRISVADLREAVRRMLDAVELQFGPTIDLDADHYWSLNPVESFDLTKEPRLEAGQVSEDVEDVRAVLTRDDGEISLWHDLAHLAAILNRISALDNPSRKEAE